MHGNEKQQFQDRVISWEMRERKVLGQLCEGLHLHLSFDIIS